MTGALITALLLVVLCYICWLLLGPLGIIIAFVICLLIILGRGRL